MRRLFMNVQILYLSLEKKLLYFIIFISQSSNEHLDIDRQWFQHENLKQVLRLMFQYVQQTSK